MKRMILSITIVAAFLFAVSFSTAPISAAMDDSTLYLQDSCTACHGLDKICSNLGNENVWWTATLKRMAGRGASLEHEQVPALATFLAAPSEDLLKRCGK